MYRLVKGTLHYHSALVQLHLNASGLSPPSHETSSNKKPKEKKYTKKHRVIWSHFKLAPLVLAMQMVIFATEMEKNNLKKKKSASQQLGENT